MQTLRGSLDVLLALVVAAAPSQDKPDATKPGTQVLGMITYKGKPLPAGFVTFHGKGMKDTFQATIDDGKYVLKNVRPGEFKVTIDTESIAAFAKQLQEQVARLEARAELLKAAKKEDADLAKRIAELKERVKTVETAQKKVVKVPAKYAAVDTSGLTFKVAPGENTFDIELK